MRTLRHFLAGLALIAMLVVAAVAFFLYDPFSSGPRFLARSQLITASGAGDEAAPVSGEMPIQATDPPAIAALALRYQPTVVLSVDDRFWPVSLLDALRMRFASRPACLYIGGRCRIRAPTAGDLAVRGSRSEFLQLPTPLDSVRDTFLAAAQALGVPAKAIRAWQRHPAMVNPFASAQVYFYYLRRAPASAYRGLPHGLVSLEYWFYYPLNYFPLIRIPLEALSHPITSTLGNTDYHQGDLEHVAVLLDPKTMRPRYLWMARHADEGQGYRWHSRSVQWEGEHAVIYSALGSHTSYARCGIQRRSRTYWFINDYVVCKPRQDYGFTYDATRLVDLAHTSWACWQGHLGEAGSALVRSVVGLLPFETDGPFSPLLQQENFSSACRASRGAQPAPPAL
jgi:hypothetical protein